MRHFFVLSCLLVAAIGFADQKVSNWAGDEFILHDDGTWSAVEPEVVDVDSVGKWRVSEDVDAMTDSRKVYLVLKADSGQNTWGDPIYLCIRFDDMVPELFVDWDTYLGSEADVMMRIGTAPSHTRRWGLSNDSEATFYPGRVSDLIEKLIDVDQLVFRMTPYNENPITAIFDIRGLRAAMESMDIPVPN